MSTSLHIFTTAMAVCSVGSSGFLVENIPFERSYDVAGKITRCVDILKKHSFFKETRDVLIASDDVDFKNEILFKMSVDFTVVLNQKTSLDGYVVRDEPKNMLSPWQIPPPSHVLPLFVTLSTLQEDPFSVVTIEEIQDRVTTNHVLIRLDLKGDIMICELRFLFVRGDGRILRCCVDIDIEEDADESTTEGEEEGGRSCARNKGEACVQSDAISNEPRRRSFNEEVVDLFMRHFDIDPFETRALHLKPPKGSSVTGSQISRCRGYNTRDVDYLTRKLTWKALVVTHMRDENVVIVDVDREMKAIYKGLGTDILAVFSNHVNVNVNVSIINVMKPVPMMPALLLSKVDQKTALAMILSDRADLALSTLLFEHSTPFHQLDFSTYLNMAKMVFESNYYDEDTSWTRMFSLFTLHLWVCLFLAIAGYLLLLGVIQLLHAKKLMKERIEVIRALSILLGQSTKHPKKLGLRIVLGMWIICCFYISVAYTSSFVSSFAVFHTPRELVNMRDLEKSKLPLGGPAYAKAYFNDSTDDVMWGLYNRFRVMPFEAAHAKMTIGDLVTVNVIESNYLCNRARSRKKRSHLCFLEEAIVTYPVVMVARKGDPCLPYLNGYFMQLQESGLFAKWFSDFQKKHFESRANEGEERSLGLTMHQLESPFYFLMVAHSISFVVFLLELFAKWRSRR